MKNQSSKIILDQKLPRTIFLKLKNKKHLKRLNRKLFKEAILRSKNKQTVKYQ